MRKNSKKGIDPALESSKAQSSFCFSCFLATGQDNREMSACHGAESRTPNPLVDKVIPQSYRKTPWKRPYCTNSSNIGQQHLKGSKMLQLSFSISPTSRAQGHAPRGEKIPKLGMENWQCRSAVKPGGQDILLGHTSGLRRMQEQTNTSQQLPKTRSHSLGNAVSPRWGKTFILHP